MSGWTGVGGKRVVMTGATNGIGLAAAEELAMRGAKVTILARDEAKANALANRIGADVVIADLALRAGPGSHRLHGGRRSWRRRVDPAPAARDADVARLLWEVSEVQAGLSVVATR